MKANTLALFIGIAFSAISQGALSLGPPIDELDTIAGPMRPVGVKCSLSTLKGTYLGHAGYLGPAGDQQEQSAMEYYDGEGQLYGKLTAKLLPDQVYSFSPYTATYEVNQDCTGRLLNKGSPYQDIYVSPDGNYYIFTITNKGYQGSGVVKRVTKRPVFGFLPEVHK
ncbi:MAG: hypothetical protein U1E83_10940 [Methylotetracoccus sp.]